jgi:hypothetical protein
MPILFSISAIDVFDQSMECDVYTLFQNWWTAKCITLENGLAGPTQKKRKKKKITSAKYKGPSQKFIYTKSSFFFFEE